MTRRPPRPAPFPYTTLFRSLVGAGAVAALHPPREDGGVHAQAVERQRRAGHRGAGGAARKVLTRHPQLEPSRPLTDRKSTRLNSSHMSISYAVFCLKKKKEK